MKFYKFWSKGSAPVDVDGRSWTLECFGGSNESLADAQRRAAEIAQKSALAMRQGGGQGGRYGYSERRVEQNTNLARQVRGQSSTVGRTPGTTPPAEGENTAEALSARFREMTLEERAAAIQALPPEERAKWDAAVDSLQQKMLQFNQQLQQP